MRVRVDTVLNCFSLLQPLGSPLSGSFPALNPEACLQFWHTNAFSCLSCQYSFAQKGYLYHLLNLGTDARTTTTEDNKEAASFNSSGALDRCWAKSSKSRSSSFCNYSCNKFWQILVPQQLRCPCSLQFVLACVISNFS